jgi:SAM-dependent methyltransferase
VADYVAEFGKDGGRVGGRLDAPAFHRNHQPIWAVLQKFLAGKAGDVLEVGSGTGQHVVHFARHSADVTWWPSDLNEQHLKSIGAWRAHAELLNVEAPLRIDLSNPDWVGAMQDAGGPKDLLAVFCANVVHIAPWRVAEGLFAGASRALRADGHLLLYGPFKRGGKHTALSNAVFDASLREGNPEWGVRDVADLEKLAGTMGLALSESIEMPANNLILVFARSSSAADAWPTPARSG